MEGGSRRSSGSHMGTQPPAEAFLRHSGLILTAAGGAVVEGGLLTLVAPNARSVAPQVTAIPSLAAYHDLRWLFTDTQSWLWFAALVAGALVARAALDVALIRLAWPRGIPAPRARSSFASCAAHRATHRRSKNCSTLSLARAMTGALPNLPRSCNRFTVKQATSAVLNDLGNCAAASNVLPV